VFVRSPQREGEAFVDDGGSEVRIPVARSGPMLVEGARVRGTVTGVERYGVFVQIEGAQGRGGRGLVPTAETGTPRGADLRKLFPVGSPIETKIVAIGEDGKIRLSVRALADDDERKNFEAYARGDAAPTEGGDAAASKAPQEKKAKQPPAPRNFGTLGDLLKGATPAQPPPPKPAGAPRKR
jgi:small subunit ribosomal protein S1